MNSRWKKLRTVFAATYIVGVSCVLGAIGGKALADHNQPAIRTFVEHCKAGGGALGLEASAAGRTLIVTPVCRFAPTPTTTPAPQPQSAAQAATRLQI